MSNRYTHRRMKLPKPAVCKGKKSVLSYQEPFPLPAAFLTAELHFTATADSSDPSGFFQNFNLTRSNTGSLWLSGDPADLDNESFTATYYPYTDTWLVAAYLLSPIGTDGPGFIRLSTTCRGNQDPEHPLALGHTRISDDRYPFVAITLTYIS